MRKGKLTTWVAGGAMMTAVAGLATAAPTAADPSATPPTTRPAAAHHRRGLTKPWSDLKTLTPQQEDQIIKIHEDAAEQENKIRQKEKDDITALLTPEQQNELADQQNKVKEDRKERTASHRKSTTQAAK